jgi:hypothetical protein
LIQGEFFEFYELFVFELFLLVPFCFELFLALLYHFDWFAAFRAFVVFVVFPSSK